MKSLLISILLIVSCQATTLTANFNGLQSSIQSGYSEGGLTFTSPSIFSVVTGQWGGTLFGWGGYMVGSALSVTNQGWVGIAAGGTTMSSVNLQYGFDWNGYMIEYGMMDVAVEWQTMLNGSLVGFGGKYFNNLVKSHGGWLTVDGSFDSILVRSVSANYGYGGRGATILPLGNENRIAIDNVSATTSSVPEGGSALWMLGFVGVALLGWRRFV